MRGDSIGEQASLVQFGAVSGIALPAVGRVSGGETAHQPVTQNLGDNRRGGDGKAACVAFYYGFSGTGQRGQSIAVNQHGRWQHRQRRYGSAHCKHSRCKNIKAVDLRYGRRADSYCRIRGKSLGDHLSALLRQCFRVLNLGLETGGQIW